MAALVTELVSGVHIFVVALMLDMVYMTEHSIRCVGQFEGIKLSISNMTSFLKFPGDFHVLT